MNEKIRTNICFSRKEIKTDISLSQNLYLNINTLGEANISSVKNPQFFNFSLMVGDIQ